VDYPRWVAAPPAWQDKLDHKLIAIVSIFGLLHNSEIIRRFQNARDPVPFAELRSLEVRESKLLTPLMPTWAVYLKFVLPAQAKLDRLEALMPKHGTLPWALSFGANRCGCRTVARKYIANGITFTVVFNVTISSGQTIYRISCNPLHIDIQGTTRETVLSAYRTGLAVHRMKLPSEDYDKLLRME
jgi:hypothetical protein